MTGLFTAPIFSPNGDVGEALPLSTLDFFEQGSTTVRQDTFADRTFLVANTNPVVADGDGRFPEIWLQGVYRVVFKEADATQVWDTDNIGSTVPPTTTFYEFGVSGVDTASGSSHTGIVTGHIIQTNYYDNNFTAESGSQVAFNGAVTPGKASNWPDADGSFYDLDGKQFELIGDLVPQKFGAVMDGATDDSTAINICWALGSNADRTVRMLGGTAYKVTSTVYATTKGSTFQSCDIIGVGMREGEGTVIDGSSLVADPVVILQLGRGTHMSKMAIKGANGDYTGIASTDFDFVNAAYVLGGVQDAQFAPQCCLAIDGGVGASPGTPWANVTYRSLSSGSRSGVFEEMMFFNSVVGVAHNVEQGPVQGNSFNYQNCFFRDVKVGFAVGGSQSRAVKLNDCLFIRYRTAVECLEYGAQQGQNPSIVGCEFGNGFEIIQGTGNTTFHIENCRGEGVFRIGAHGTGASNIAFPAEIINLDIELVGSKSGAPTIFEGPFTTNYRGGGVYDPGFSPLNYIGQPTIFEGHKFRVEDAEDYVVDGGWNLAGPMEHIASIVQSNSDNYRLSPRGNQQTLSGPRINGVSGSYGQFGGNPLWYVPNKFQKLVGFSTASNWSFSDTQLTFDSTDVTYILPGDYIYWLMNAVGSSASGHILAALKVVSVAAPTVTCDLLFKRLYYNEASVPATMYIHLNTQYAPGQALTGDTNTSTSVTNVSPTTILKIGDWLAGSADIVANTRITNITAGVTLTLNKAASGTSVGVALFWDRLHDMDTTVKF